MLATPPFSQAQLYSYHRFLATKRGAEAVRADARRRARRLANADRGRRADGDGSYPTAGVADCQGHNTNIDALVIARDPGQRVRSQEQGSESSN